jgi:hypothetical protein
MEIDQELFVYGMGPLPCSIGELEDEVFGEIEGLGDVTGSGSGARGWNLDITFESPNAFTAIVRSVGKVLTTYGVDLSTVEISIRGRFHRLSDRL